MVSNISQISQLVLDKTIDASYGDAFLAGLAVGAVDGLGALKRDRVRITKEIRPDSIKRKSTIIITNFLRIYTHSP
jgi:hypothetical protein